MEEIRKRVVVILFIDENAVVDFRVRNDSNMDTKYPQISPLPW